VIDNVSLSDSSCRCSTFEDGESVSGYWRFLPRRDQPLHAAVDIFIFRVLIPKDGPNRFQGSVKSYVMNSLRTAAGDQCFMDFQCRRISTNTVGTNTVLLAVTASRVFFVVL
jgi:hypothetical protein